MLINACIEIASKNYGPTPAFIVNTIPNRIEEILSDFQITIPELGTIAATSKPIVVLTANGTRDLSDALRRRCIFSHVPFPDRATELAILRMRAPALSPRLAGQIVGFVQSIRKEDLEKKPKKL